MFDDLSLYPRSNAIIGTVGLPWWNIGGNHDLNFEAPDRRYSRETYKRFFGPNYYAFFYAETLFLMLDDVDYLGLDPKQPRGAGKYEGRLDERQLEFVRGVLEHTPDGHAHHRRDAHPDPHLSRTTNPIRTCINSEAFFSLFEGRRYTVSFAGHTHTTEHHYFDAADGWKGAAPHHHHVLTALSGSWWSGPYDHRGVACADSRDGTPNGFHILSVDGLSYTTRFIPAKEPNGRQMRLSIDSRFHGISKEADRDFRQAQLLGSPVPRDALSASTLIANVFDGGEKTKVSMTIGDRAPVPMVRRARPDPFVEEVFARNEATKKSWVKAEVSSHIWTARLPGDLAPGAYRVAVEAINEYGKPVSGRLTLEVTGIGKAGLWGCTFLIASGCYQRLRRPFLPIRNCQPPSSSHGVSSTPSSSHGVFCVKGFGLARHCR